MSLYAYRHLVPFERVGHQLQISCTEQFQGDSEMPSEESLASDDLRNTYESFVTQCRELLSLNGPASLINLCVEHSKTLEGEYVQKYSIHDINSRAMCLRSDSLGFLQPEVSTLSTHLA